MLLYNLLYFFLASDFLPEPCYYSMESVVAPNLESVHFLFHIFRYCPGFNTVSQNSSYNYHLIIRSRSLIYFVIFDDFVHVVGSFLTR